MIPAITIAPERLLRPGRLAGRIDEAQQDEDANAGVPPGKVAGAGVLRGLEGGNGISMNVDMADWLSMGNFSFVPFRLDAVAVGGRSQSTEVR
jgi:hypothetical protein